MQYKINKIRQECILANPEIVELKFGCKISFKTDTCFGGAIIYDTDYEDYGKTEKYRITGYPKSIYKKDFIEIIGRDIRLADVLYMLSEKYKFQSTLHFMSFNGGFYDKGALLAEYNLLDDNLEHQSEDCINFIYNLINEEK